MIEGLQISKLERIPNINGDLFKIIKTHDSCYKGFGELYISEINKNSIKGWKKHLKMTLNLVVMRGKIKFVFYDDNSFSRTYKKTFSILVKSSDKVKLCVSPGIYMAFMGYKDSMLINFADIEHDDREGVRLNLDQISYKWDS